MYCYYKNVLRKRRRKRILSLFLSILIIVGCYFYYTKRVVKSVAEYSYDALNARVNMSVNSAILFTLNNLSYEDLVVVEKNPEGNVEILATNSYKVNYINREVIRVSQEFVEIDCKKGINIPCGTLTGINLLSGYGKTFNYKILAVGSVYSNFVSEFEGVSINQTRHAIYLEITTDVKVIMPLKKETLKLKTKILICDSVIVGKIPDVYLKGSIF